MKQQTGRVNSRAEKNRNVKTEHYYVEGNAVRRLEEVPEVRPERKQNRNAAQKLKRNREKAMRMGRGYILFLCGISAVTLVTCVSF